MARQEVPQTFEEFESQLKLAHTFGQKQIKQLDLENAPRSQFTHTFGNVINRYLNVAIDADLFKVQQRLEMEQTPRGDNKPELTNRNQGVSPAQRSAYKNAPWMDKMDLVADPKIRNAFRDFNNTMQDPKSDKAALTTQFSDLVKKLENSLKQQYKMKMQGPRPSPSRKHRPEPF